MVSNKCIIGISVGIVVVLATVAVVVPVVVLRNRGSSPTQAPAARTGLTFKDQKFYLDGRPFVIISGAIHYFRIVPEYWRDRLLKLKAAGLNTLETYMAWNLHEEIRGQWNFKKMLDIKAFIQLAKELDLYVILRPGPYICSEWDLGGLPSWLLHDPYMKLRTNYQPFIAASTNFITKVMEEVQELQYKKGGPIIAFQLENEYGSYGNDTSYMEAVKKMFTDNGAIEPFFTSDNDKGLTKGMVPGAILSINFNEKRKGEIMMRQVQQLRPGNPCLVMEYWSGWFNHWTDILRNGMWIEDFEEVLDFIFKSNCSVNFYMFHGGTSFGFMNGANDDSWRGYLADITSYDYDAPLSEAGDVTDKIDVIKNLVKTYARDFVPDPLPEQPPNSTKSAYGTVYIDHLLPWTAALQLMEPIKLTNVTTMEMLDINNGGGQAYGYIVYRKNITEGGTLKLATPVRDRVIVLLDGMEQATFMYDDDSAETNLTLTKDLAVLDIMVENLGRINYGNLMDDQRKGLHEQVTINGEILQEWEIYPLELKEHYINSLLASNLWVNYTTPDARGPAFTKGTLHITGTPHDTFLHPLVHDQSWEKGVVFINGFNLGRYWDVGPQMTLYVPAPIFRPGDNEVLIFELHNPSSNVTFVDKPDLGDRIL